VAVNMQQTKGDIFLQPPAAKKSRSLQLVGCSEFVVAEDPPVRGPTAAELAEERKKAEKKRADETQALEASLFRSLCMCLVQRPAVASGIQHRLKHFGCIESDPLWREDSAWFEELYNIACTNTLSGSFLPDFQG